MKFDSHVDPLSISVEKAMKAGHQALDKVQKALGTSTGLGELTNELSETARSIRIFIDMLERNPNAIIFGKKTKGGRE
ncbi:MAG: hypothetical protein HQK84_06310 [Nitrospinae bacterium]|nr:hypothetical protein [Nitrospinota bacterium]